jgi:hypothetical protein
VDCSLYLKSSAKTIEECRLILCFVALAVGDPTVLCNCGKRLKGRDEQNSQSWLQWPLFRDVEGAFVRKKLHRRLDAVPRFGHKQIVLDLLILGNVEILHYASQPFIARAAWFVDGCMENDVRDHCELANECMLGSTVDTSKRELFITALACALEYGPSWMNKSVLSKSAADPLLMKGLLCFFGPDVDLTETFKQRYDYCEQHYGRFWRVRTVHIGHNN